MKKIQRWGRMIAIALASTTTATVAAQSPPEAPAGFHWEIKEAFSDEFNGTELDRAKWHDHNPDWQGRAPGKFMPSSVRVADGYLKIQCTPLDPPQGKFTIACGTIQSRSREARYGYYECRMKASHLSTSTNFWMVGDHVKVADGTLAMELIIQFAIGKSPEHNHHMKSNAMIALKPAGEGTQRRKAKRTERVKLSSGVADDFHTYGVWWVDANTMKFYADGRYVYTIEPSTDFDDQPFRHPLTLNLICETFDWQPMPTTEELTDSDRNTAYFDYVRAYTLVQDH